MDVLLIEPGKGIGEIKLGMTKGEVSECIYNPELDSYFTFPALGLGLWRPYVLKEEDLEKEWFKEMKPSIQEDTMKNLYFSSVCIYLTK